MPWVGRISPDILCLQETKCQVSQLPSELSRPAGYETFWHSAERPGYSGVSTWAKTKPLSFKNGFGQPRFDAEGRVLETEFPEFTLLNIYFPNGGRGEERLRYKLEFYSEIFAYFQKLRADKKRLVICGDYNIAHHPVDIADPDRYEDVSGFMPVERRWLDRMVAEGFVDTYRALHPEDKEKYTWWDQRLLARKRNFGWRIDYFFVSGDLKPHIKEAFIWDDVMGSDHCPVGIILQF